MPPGARRTSPSPRSRRAGPRIAVVVSRYNASITDALLHGAVAAHASLLPGAGTPAIIDAPGAFEIPALALAAARKGYDGIVAIGCIIRGETRHDEFLASAVTSGLVSITIATGVPIGLAVLTVNTPEQARDRAGGSLGNKGSEAMHALLDTIAAARSIPRPGSSRSSVSSLARVAARPDKAASSARTARRTA